MNKEQTITASEAREKLLVVWTKCEFGVKERVKRLHSHRTIQYILETETYSNTDKVLEIIESVKAVAQEVKDEAEAMNSSIQKSLS